ncbi:transcription factor IIA subunit alpha [Recurvomyces mirabilis]|nr:transcription factor IIA subunit alpha [Recurvomyces mirabilis]
MTNHLVGDVYLKIIQDVIRDSKAEFEENGVSQTTLTDLEQVGLHPLFHCAHMPACTFHQADILSIIFPHVTSAEREERKPKIMFLFQHTALQNPLAKAMPDAEQARSGALRSQNCWADLCFREWKTKLSSKHVAHMPWDPKPEPPPMPQPQAPSLPSAAATSGLPQQYNSAYNQPPPQNSAPRIKAEPNYEQPYHGLPNNGFPQGVPQIEGGQARAQVLSQQYMQRNGLALPGQRPQAMPPNAQQLTPAQMQQYMQQQQQRQQAAMQQQQAQPRIKVENDSPQLIQGQFQQQQQQQQQRQPNPAYAQTDGADEGLSEWQAYMAQRRAATAEQMQHADRMMQDSIEQRSADLESGLMVPLNAQPKGARNKKRRVPTAAQPFSSTLSSVPQLDGVKEDEDEKPVKDEEDEDAINSDLDSDEDPTGDLNDDDDEGGDTILCTYDKVQRVKNKWKCVLKDGVLSIGNKEWVFHKGNGEFEW